MSFLGRPLPLGCCLMLASLAVATSNRVNNSFLARPSPRWKDAQVQVGLRSLSSAKHRKTSVLLQDSHENAGSDDTSTIACESISHIPKDVKCMFINLDSRTDRRAKFEQNISKQLEPFKRCLGWSLERFPAILAEKGGKGMRVGQIAAARSHVAALKKGMENVEAPTLIFEDDFGFTGSPAATAERLASAFKAMEESKAKKWDVMMLGDNSFDGVTSAGENTGLLQTQGAWCSEAYLVAPKYKAILLQTVEDGLKKMEAGNKHVNAGVEPLGAAYDTLWYPLQQKDNWYVFRPKLGQQRDTWGDSNIN